MKSETPDPASPGVRCAIPGTVKVGHAAPGLAVVSMCGEHDFSTTPELARALAKAAAQPSVVVDLSECSFMDSTVIGTLIKAARTAEAGGDRLVLVIPREQANVARVAQLTRLADVVNVHELRGEALADLQAR